MKKLLLSFAAVLFSAMCFAAPPAITGTPVIDAPKLLNFAPDVTPAQPDLTEQTANRLYDLHGTIANCDSVDFVLSTAGNYHMALRDLWYNVVLPSNPGVFQSWYYTTSPPISKEQTNNSQLTVGNLSLKCIPSVVVAPKAEIDSIVAAGLSTGSAVKVLNNRGNVLVVKKGNPKGIQSVMDLGRNDVKVVTPNPVTEPSTFKNYSTTIYQIAQIAYGDQVANDLYTSVFNSPGRWFAGARIHHREVPWSIAHGKADVGVLFYHIALNLVRQFPEEFEIVPLGGTADNPVPLPGNNIGAHFAIRINVAGKPLNERQTAAREVFMSAVVSEDFAQILEQHGLARP